MNPTAIQPGTRIRNIHWNDEFVIERVTGLQDDSMVLLRMDGPAGSCFLDRKFATIRDHFETAE